jgi:phage-related protein
LRGCAIDFSHSDLKGFPEEPRRDAGFNLDFVQRGFEPENWKPIKTVGAVSTRSARERARMPLAWDRERATLI